jgi:hypothetical protein
MQNDLNPTIRFTSCTFRGCQHKFCYDCVVVSVEQEEHDAFETGIWPVKEGWKLVPEQEKKVVTGSDRLRAMGWTRVPEQGEKMEGGEKFLTDGGNKMTAQEMTEVLRQGVEGVWEMGENIRKEYAMKVRRMVMNWRDEVASKNVKMEGKDGDGEGKGKGKAKEQILAEIVARNRMRYAMGPEEVKKAEDKALAKILLSMRKEIEVIVID